MFNYLAVICKSKGVGTNNNLMLSPRPSFRSRVRVQAALGSMLTHLWAHFTDRWNDDAPTPEQRLAGHDNAVVVL